MLAIMVEGVGRMERERGGQQVCDFSDARRYGSVFETGFGSDLMVVLGSKSESVDSNDSSPDIFLASGKSFAFVVGVNV